METCTTDIGSRIKEAREQRGLTVRDIANTTKISPSALNAIERNDCARLPGGVYSRACLRAFVQEDTVPTGARDATADVVFAAKAAVSEAGARSLQLEIRFIRSCWVSASADGTRVVSRLMQPGERALVDARRMITLRVGDAGAVDYSINGVTGRPLGSDGEVVTVRITGDGLQMTSITSRQDEMLTASM